MKKIEIVSSVNDKVLNVVSRNDISYNLANKLLRQKDIRINNKKISENVSVRVGDLITYFIPDENPKENSVDITFENEFLIVVNKPKGIEVDSEGNNLLKKLKNFKKDDNIFALNRLDRNTEGLTLFAKGKNNFEELKKAMKNGQVQKHYLAEVVGVPSWNNKSVVSYLLKDEDKSEVQILDFPKKDAIKIETHFQVISRSSGGTSVIEASIKNGKTHQIRAQLAHIGYAIVGDGKYGKNQDNKKFKTKTQKLTCFKLEFNFTKEKFKQMNDENIEIKPTWMKI